MADNLTDNTVAWCFPWILDQVRNDGGDLSRVVQDDLNAGAVTAVEHVEGFVDLVQAKVMGDQRLKVDDAALNKVDAGGVIFWLGDPGVDDLDFFEIEIVERQLALGLRVDAER